MIMLDLRQKNLAAVVGVHSNMSEIDLEVIACGFVVAMILWFLGEFVSSFYRAFKNNGQ